MPPRLRRRLLLGASGLALAIALGGANDAAAIDECGPASGAPPSVTCTSAGNPYPNGIYYDVADLTIVVNKGVIIDTTGTVGELGGLVNGDRSPFVGATAFGDLVVTVSSGVSITTDDTDADGIAAGASFGVGGNSATITSQATITTFGDYANGIRGHAYGGDVKITAGGSIATKGSNADGILISSNLTTNHVLTIDSSAMITTSGDWSSGLRADSEYNTNVDIFIKSSGKITTSGKYAEGIYGSSAHVDSDITITSSSTITTTGDEGHGIRGFADGPQSAIVISSSGRISTSGRAATGLYALTDGVDSDIAINNLGTIATSGEEANGIRAITNRADSGIDVVSSGRITTLGGTAAGIAAGSIGSDSDVMVVSTAKIATNGDESHAIVAVAAGNNNDVTITSTGDLVTIGNEAHGIYSLTAGQNSKTSITSTGSIKTSGHQADGIHATTIGTGATVSILSAGSITTVGGEADGIEVDALGDVTITATGKISTKGAESDGIFVESILGNIAINASSAIVTHGVIADGIHAAAAAGNITISSTGNIKTSGDQSHGIWARAAQGTVAINAAATITTSGNGADAVHAEADDAITIAVKKAIASGMDSDGIHAENSDLGAITVTVDGGVSGGWGSGQGVRVKAANPSSITVTKAGSIGALSDFALSEGGDDLLIVNQGTITGFIDVSAGNDALLNYGVWNLRAFADTNGDGVRDTERVAVAHFGSGVDHIDNIGTLRLANVVGATSVITTGQIADPFGSDSDITLPGVEQGHLLGLEQFVNSGTITLQDGTVGDILAITNQNVVGPGGGGVFRSNGGSLRLDVFLDDGSSGATDMLFLDIAATSGGGPTKVFIANAGGPGGLTKGDGIQIINVDVSSTSDAFTLGAPVIAGAFQYGLAFQNVAGTDQSWYLRSTPYAGAIAYPALSSSALVTWRADLAAFQQRLGELRLGLTTPAPAAGIADGGSIGLDPARVTGGWFQFTESSNAVSQVGIADFGQETARASMGFDFALDNVFGRDDWLIIGAFGGQGWSQADFRDADAAADFEIAAMGVYASYLRGPYHVDALVKYDWLYGDYRSDAVSGGDVALPVFGVSLNTGYRFDLTSGETSGLSLQPFAGLDYAHVGGDSFRDRSGAEIELLEMDSLRGRIGAELVQQLLPDETGTGPVGTLRVRAGLAQELLGESTARVTGVTLSQEMPRTTLELGAGFDIALPAEGIRFTFETSADLSGGEDNFGATGGVKFTW